MTADAPAGARLEGAEISAPADSTAGWIDRLAPAAARPYLRLARAERPIGSWLLFIPCLWSIALAARIDGGWSGYAAALVLLYGIGSVAMRGAGCTWNDILDRNIDGLVERTRRRPIPSGQVSVRGAFAFLFAQAMIGLLVLLFLPPFAMAVAVSSLGLVAVYPLMKRIISVPQLVLGLTFSWGALMGFAALLEALPVAGLLLYAGCVLWVVGYDTIYAHQDREDDAMIGVKSSALLFAGATRLWLIGIYAGAVALLAAALVAAAAGPAAWAGLLFFAGHLAWQVARLDIDDAGACLAVFRSNRDAGLLFFAGLALDAALA